MERVNLNRNKRIILNQLAENNYPSPVPQKDLKDFLELEDVGFASHFSLDQSSMNQLYGPQITDKGRRYLVENPKLKNPKWKFDWKWLIGTIVTALGIIATVWVALK